MGLDEMTGGTYYAKVNSNEADNVEGGEDRKTAPGGARSMSVCRVQPPVELDEAPAATSDKAAFLEAHYGLQMQQSRFPEVKLLNGEKLKEKVRRSMVIEVVYSSFQPRAIPIMYFFREQTVFFDCEAALPIFDAIGAGAPRFFDLLCIFASVLFTLRCRFDKKNLMLKSFRYQRFMGRSNRRHLDSIRAKSLEKRWERRADSETSAFHAVAGKDVSNQPSEIDGDKENDPPPHLEVTRNTDSNKSHTSLPWRNVKAIIAKKNKMISQQKRKFELNRRLQVAREVFAKKRHNVDKPSTTDNSLNAEPSSKVDVRPPPPVHYRTSTAVSRATYYRDKKECQKFIDGKLGPGFRITKSPKKVESRQLTPRQTVRAVAEGRFSIRQLEYLRSKGLVAPKYKMYEERNRILSEMPEDSYIYFFDEDEVQDYLESGSENKIADFDHEDRPWTNNDAQMADFDHEARPWTNNDAQMADFDHEDRPWTNNDAQMADFDHEARPWTNNDAPTADFDHEAQPWTNNDAQMADFDHEARPWTDNDAQIVALNDAGEVAAFEIVNTTDSDEPSSSTTKPPQPPQPTLKVKFVSAYAIVQYYCQDPTFVDQFPPGDIRITVFGDGGGKEGNKSCKVVMIFNDIPTGLSTNRQIMLAQYFGEETDSNLSLILPLIDEDLKKLKEGVDTCYGRRFFELFFGGDLKFEHLSYHLQSSSATYFCLWCLAPLNQMHKNAEHQLRKMESHLENCQGFVAEFEKLKNEDASDLQISKLKQKFFSTNGVPYIKSVDFEHVIPPMMHILSGIVHHLLKYGLRKDREKVRAAEVGFGRAKSKRTQQYVAKDAQAFTEYIQQHNTDIPFSEEHKLIAAMHPYAEARDLSTKDLDELDGLIKKFGIQSRNDNLKFCPKMHILEHHVIPFARHTKSLGKYSEEGIESLHHKVNVSNRNIPLRRDQMNDERRLDYFADTQKVMNFFVLQEDAKTNVHK
uniref:ULP_PROTEASE domain-containing protein n=1 Tax=Panagrellus redivivus TaxID=6233 RepID=A0A7E4V0T1_PANRE